MRKIFMTLSASATLALAIAFNSCNNAEEAKKQMEEQNIQIQTMVDEQLNGLQEQVNTECTDLVDSLAGVQYAVFLAEAKKAGKKGGAKAKPKPTVKKEEPKTEPTINNRPGSEESNKSTITNRTGTEDANKSTIRNRAGATQQTPPK